MAPMSSSEPSSGILHRHRRVLFDTARAAVEHAVRTGRELDVDPSGYAPELRAPAATFVSLHRGGELLGCIGTLAPIRPLVVDVAGNAASAVLRDPRCPLLGPRDVPDIDIDLSLLGPAEPMDVTSESDLVAKLRPGVDGVILEDRGRRGTFLPVVWESIPDPAEFVLQLKRKAGLPMFGWSPTIRVFRYTTESVSDRDAP